jgi:hypothetical protein
MRIYAILRALMALMLVIKFIFEALAATITVFLLIASVLFVGISMRADHLLSHEQFIIPVMALVSVIVMDGVCKSIVMTIATVLVRRNLADVVDVRKMRPFAIGVSKDWSR